jgi:hypothetical protein
MTRRLFKMDTFLTLVIAIGGITTGIGAIWTAMLGRRQLSEQRQFLKEQNEIARSQAQLTERSLAQTERSLAEQGESLREQNERTRLNLEFDLLNRTADRFESSHFRSRRRAAARYLLDIAFVEDEKVEMESFTREAADVGGVFEDLGYLQRLGVLRAESVWNRFGKVTQVYWLLCKPAIEKIREDWKAPELFTEFERLSHLMAELDHEQGIEPPTQEILHQYMEYEAVIGEEPPRQRDGI